MEEEKLLINLEELNSSFKYKDKKKFIETISNLYNQNADVNCEISKENLRGNKSKLDNSTSKRSLSYDQMENIDFKIKNDKNNNNESYNSNLEDCISTFATSKNNNESNKTNDNSHLTPSKNKNNIENLINQNLNMCFEQLKLIVIGDKQVGKTSLINKILKVQSFDFKNYEPTLR